MKNFIGAAGRYLREQATSQRLKVIVTCCVLLNIVHFVLGFAAAKHSLLWTLPAIAFAFLVYNNLQNLSETKLGQAEREKIGPAGACDLVRLLEDLPDTYTVINDLTFSGSYGNIDHLIVGPAGVFAIDVKSWCGTVSADGKGELLWNGKPTGKPEIRNFTRKVMGLKNRVKALSQLDPSICCILVFPRASVDAKWGTTASVHCIRANQAMDYATRDTGLTRLSLSEVDLFVSSVRALQKLAAGPWAAQRELAGTRV